MIYDTGANGVLFKSFLHHSASQNKQEHKNNNGPKVKASANKPVMTE